MGKKLETVIDFVLLPGVILTAPFFGPPEWTAIMALSNGYPKEEVFEYLDHWDNVRMYWACGLFYGFWIILFTIIALKGA